MRLSSIICVFAAALAYAPNALPCTTFALPGTSDRAIGKSYDRSDGFGYLMVNKRHVEKTALLMPGQTNPAKWTSKYGSLTFNQLARELPMGGLNEAGLAVEIMVLSETEYPPPSDHKPAVNESQWIQYVLDNYANVSDVIAGTKLIKIEPAAERVHYLVCDKGGSCASFEYLDEKLVVHTGAEFQEFALTNSVAGESIDFIKGYTGFGGTKAIPQDQGSLSRFVRASALAREYRTDTNGTDRAFDILEAVRWPGFSQWQIVYAAGKGTVTFRTDHERSFKTIDLAGLDFRCTTEVGVHNVDVADASDLTHELEPYSIDLNRTLITKAASTLPIPIGPDLIELVAHYPETTRCKD